MTLKPNNWKHMLRKSNSEVPAKVLKSQNVNSYKVTSQNVRNMLEELYRRFINQNTHLNLTYHEYFDNLVEIGIISDKPDDILSKTNRLIMPVFVPRMGILYVKTDFKDDSDGFLADMDRDETVVFKSSKYENHLESISEHQLIPELKGLALSIFNSLIENLNAVLDKFHVQLKKTKSKPRQKSNVNMTSISIKSNNYDHIISSCKIQRKMILHRDIVKLMHSRLSTYDALYMRYKF